jgi:aminopeptidase C
MWQKITHATLLIGWGYDEKLDMKYWLVRNSYGSSWGEGGNFRVRRGQNDFGAEGENSAATPVLL